MALDPPLVVLEAVLVCGDGWLGVVLEAVLVCGDGWLGVELSVWDIEV